MSRRRGLWTIYDDDERHLERELIEEESVDIDFSKVMEVVLKRMKGEDIDHFEKESNLFEV